ncbi:MAG TPA: hypothetical protein VN249_07885, partial [Prolixibacteraceae bacterium]|nr:hypothetical protein [Prolixibacteraceae bacterium]
QTLSQPGLELSEEEGQVSFLYTKKEPRPAFCYRIKKSASASMVRFVTVIAPYEKEVPGIIVRIVGDPESASGNLNLEIEENGKTKQIGYTL